MNMTVISGWLYPNPCYNEMCCKGTSLCYDFRCWPSYSCHLVPVYDVLQCDHYVGVLLRVQFVHVNTTLGRL